ncbi:MAG: TonB-dependent receptor [Gammaproteobacteria bacterium]|nr:TonB-dependent receptor [Gammaproteobacteria bacterium]
MSQTTLTRFSRRTPAAARLSALAVAIAAATNAGAQGTPEEIVVTAQFRSQNLQETPIAITAVTADTMEARSQTSIYEVSAQAPNVTLKPQGAAFGPSLAASIRGVGQYDFNPAYEPGVGLYVDDVYYATLTGSIFDLLDLDRVEILRGPQGTLAGRNSIGGSVKLYSKTPTGDNTGYLAATYGIRNRLDFRGSADFALSDSLAMRLAGVSKKQEGYVKRLDYGCANPTSGIPAMLPSQSNCILAKEGEVDTDAVRAMLNWDNGGSLTVNLIADYTHEDRTTAPNVLTYANFTDTGSIDTNPFSVPLALDSRFITPEGEYWNYGNFTNPADGNREAVQADGRLFFRGWGLSSTVDWEINDGLALKSITAYREYDSGFSNDNDASPLTNSLGFGTLDFWSFSQELRLNGAFGANDQVEWTLGGFYMDQESTYATFQDLRYSTLPQFQGNDPVAADSLAFFAHANWAVTDRATLVAGVRYTDESKKYTFLRKNRDGSAHPVLGGLDGAVGDYSGDKIDWRVSGQYQWNDDIMTYLQVATGFKGGGVNPRPFVASQAQGFGQEQLTSYEFGMKGQFFDSMLRLNSAVFYSRYKDIQLTANSCPQFSPGNSATFPCALPVNAGNADVWGFESEAVVYATEALLIDASISYLDFEYTYVNPVAGGITLDNTTPFTPEWKWSIGIQYEIDMGDLGSLTPRFDASYQDDVFTNSSNSALGAIDSYTLANLRLTWRSVDEDWVASFELTNVFDKYYYLTKFDASGRSGFVSAQPGRPQEWAFTVRRNF